MQPIPSVSNSESSGIGAGRETARGTRTRLEEILFFVVLFRGGRLRRNLLSASGPETGPPGRMLAGLLPGKHRNPPSDRPKAGREAISLQHARCLHHPLANRLLFIASSPHPLLFVRGQPSQARREGTGPDVPDNQRGPPALGGGHASWAFEGREQAS